MFGTTVQPPPERCHHSSIRVFATIVFLWSISTAVFRRTYTAVIVWKRSGIRPIRDIQAKKSAIAGGRKTANFQDEGVL